MNIRNTVFVLAVLTGIFTLVIGCHGATKVKEEAQGLATQAGPAQVGRKVLNFNRDWKFAKGENSGAENIDFDDSQWQAVRLPHDWAISGRFNPKESGYAGKLPWRGGGWYRKTFNIDKADEGKRVYFDFDGVMAFPTVYVNGQLAGGGDYGYMAFRVDATPYVKFDGTNVIAVQVDTRN